MADVRSTKQLMIWTRRLSGTRFIDYSSLSGAGGYCGGATNEKRGPLMAKDAREMMLLLAAGYEKLAVGMEADAQAVARTLPASATEYDKGYFAGYTEGRVKELREMAHELHKVLRDNPPSRFSWPRISLGFTWRF